MKKTQIFDEKQQKRKAKNVNTNIKQYSLR